MTLQKRLRAIENEYHGEGCYTPTLAVSAHVFTEDVESYLAAGFDGFLGKPLVENQLVQMLNRFLRDQYTVINTDSYEPNERVETEQNENNEMIIDEKVIQGDVTILGKDRMTKIIGLFVHSSKINMSELQQAIVNKEAYQVNQLAHKLKGSAGSLGLMKLYALCHEYEKASKEGDISICNKDELQNTYDNSVIAVEKIIL